MARVTRRTFVQSVAVAGGGLVLPGAARARAAAASSKVNLLSVGVGGKGWSDLMEITKNAYCDVVAICDIDEGPQNLGRAAEKFSSAKQYTDWRKAIEQKGVDAVHIATPDHMHAPVALAALELGKHVYCQKPLTHSVAEARELRNAAEKAKTATQMGNQIQSAVQYRAAVQLVHDGVIGKVREVHSWQGGKPGWPQAMDRPQGEDPVPASVHWNDWLGVAPTRPYKAGVYHPFKWRGWQDFANGTLGDFGCHILDPVFMSLGLTAPRTVKADCPAFNRETWPERTTVEYEFPGTERTVGRGIRVTWYDGDGAGPPREALGLPESAKLPKAGSVLIGEKGTMVLAHVDMPKLYPEDQFSSYKLPDVGARNHYTSWIDACRGEDKTTSHFSYAGPLTETALLGTVAMRRRGETLQWNAEEMKFDGSPEATKLLSREYRREYALPSKKS